jgi:hypothetical protein
VHGDDCVFVTGRSQELNGPDHATLAYEAESVAIGGGVLVAVPERAVVGGVDGHGRVITPTERIDASLRAGTCNDGYLALGHRPQEVRGQWARVADPRVQWETLYPRAKSPDLS